MGWPSYVPEELLDAICLPQFWPRLGRHALWTEADGTEPCGHVLPDEAVLAAPLRLMATLLHGDVGSLIGATFEDGCTVHPLATELFIEHGVVEPGADGRPCATVDVTLVDYTGTTSRGRLRRGANSVLVTFELVVQPLE